VIADILFAVQNAPQQPPPREPLIVKIVQTPHDPTGLADILIGAFGLTGVLILVAVVAAAAMAGVLFWIRRRSVESSDPAEDLDQRRVTR
jgi:hypothetical protein